MSVKTKKCDASVVFVATNVIVVATVIVSWSAKLNVPEPFDFNIWLAEPSAAGKV